jgi:putative intracellular protease/amidase
MYASGKPVAAVCHAPAVLRHTRTSDGSPLIQGKSVTGFSNSEEEAVQLSSVVPFLLEDELSAKGAKYSKLDDWQDYAITDGNLITGQNPASSGSVAKAVLQALKK